MQSNVQVTPQIADLGAAVIGAVLAVLDDPKAAAKAVRVRNAAAKLSDDELAQLALDRQFMQDTASEREKQQQWQDAVKTKEAALTTARDKLVADQNAHTGNVDILGISQKDLNDKLAKFAKDQAEFKKKCDRHNQDAQKFAHDQDTLRSRELAVAKREQALFGAVAAMQAAPGSAPVLLP